MNRPLRLLIALAILVAGLALVPYIGLSHEKFGWNQYAGVYYGLTTPHSPAVMR